MAIPKEYQIDFSRIDGEDFPCVAQSRLLEFLQEKEVLGEFLQALAKLEQADYLVALDLLKNRCIAHARGESLDFLGRIVKQPRVNLNQGDKLWWGMDHVTSYVGHMDTSNAWIDGYAVLQDVVAADPDYRQFIAAKAIKNNIKFCSVTDIQNFVRTAYGIECSVRRTGTRVIKIIVPKGTPFGTIETLKKFYITDRYDAGYILPILAGVRVDDVITA